MGTPHICVPFPRAAQYRPYVDDSAQSRQSLPQMLRQHPEPSRVAPLAALNGFPSHPNWLHHFLLASSMGGLRL
jgi:hypothetical protein